MNPIWTPMIHQAVKKVTKTCPHCRRTSVYSQKKTGQFYKCRKCGHRFKEKG
jgi:predicted RNA-binding Zn-ribbon protein involved in translation (DUF1610 family)